MKKIFLLISALPVLLSSCNLDLEPKQDLNDALATSTYNYLDLATAANYGSLTSGSWYNGSFALAFDVMCGNGMIGPYDSGRMISENTWNFTPNSTMGYWATAYNCILNCNRVLSAIEANEFDHGTATQQDINNIKAENLFLRALAYFDLVRLYAQPYSYIKANNITGVEALGVPIVLVDDLSLRPSRSTVAEVYETLIIPNLQEAESLMSDSYVRANAIDRAATVTKPIIQALMSRVYLEHEDFQLAADYATKVINNGRYRLLSGDNYVSIWKTSEGAPATAASSGSEIIFEVYIDRGDNSSTSIGNYMTLQEDNPMKGGYGDVRVSNDLIALYDENDVRYTQLTSTTKRADFQSYGYRWCTKYPGKGWELPYNNVPIFRISEMYLNRAEALYRGANAGVTVAGTTALEDLNRVATTRGASSYSNVTITNLLNERRKEFLFEGHVFFDMKRLQQSLTRTDYDLDPTTKDIPFPSYRWAMPIPHSEILVNQNLVQNPGYNVQ